MRKLAVLISVFALFMIPTGALAQAPVVLDEGVDTFGPFVDPDLSAACGFDVTIEGAEHFKVTLFFDKDGLPTHITVHVRGSAHLSSAGGEAWDRWAFSVVEDIAEGTATFNGNVFNVHAGSGGVLVNDSGQVIFNGELIVHGPHQALFGEADDLCAALAP